MPTKIYEIRGVVETSRVFRIGNTSIRCTFSGGSVNESGSVPAVFVTSDFATQSIIEASRDFKDNTIQLKTVIGGDIVEQDKPTVSVDYPEVTNTQAAKEILIGEPYNVSLDDLKNKSAILNKAAELGIKFPSWR